jgi:hypothetical protein
VYTSGLACGFFALDVVPVHLVRDVAGTMNFLSARVCLCAPITRARRPAAQLHRLCVQTCRPRRGRLRHVCKVSLA